MANCIHGISRLRKCDDCEAGNPAAIEGLMPVDQRRLVLLILERMKMADATIASMLENAPDHPEKEWLRGQVYAHAAIRKIIEENA